MNEYAQTIYYALPQIADRLGTPKNKYADPDDLPIKIIETDLTSLLPETFDDLKSLFSAVFDLFGHTEKQDQKYVIPVFRLIVSLNRTNDYVEVTEDHLRPYPNHVIQYALMEVFFGIVIKRNLINAILDDPLYCEYMEKWEKHEADFIAFFPPSGRIENPFKMATAA